MPLIFCIPEVAMLGRIHSCETLGGADGPGLRYVLFMQGCPLRCLYCHNPDTWDIRGGREVTDTEAAAEIIRYKRYFGRRGGVTVSGGEPLIQAEFVASLFSLLKKENIHTALDTSGAVYRENLPGIDALLSRTDLVLLDIKHIDTEGATRLTGRGNDGTLALAQRLSRDGIPVWIRQVLLPGVTDTEEYLTRTREFIDRLGNVGRVEVLPYHTLGRVKYEKLGIEYPLGDLPVPDAESVKRAKQILCRDAGDGK